MGKNARGALAVFIAAVVAGMPVVAEMNSRGEQIKVEQANSDRLEDQIMRQETDLAWSRTSSELHADEAKRKAIEVDMLRREVGQLKKDLANAKAQAKRPAVRKAASTKRIARASVKVGAAGNCESYRGLVASYFPANQVDNALLTMRRESGCNPRAVSPAKDYGLMQINYRSHRDKVGSDPSVLFDPTTNVRIAAQIYRQGGWCPWVAVRGILC